MAQPPYSIRATADNVVRCINSGFFKAGPAPPTSYDVGDILSGALFNPPSSTNLYTTSSYDPLSVIQFTPGTTYEWSAFDDFTKRSGTDRRFHINNLSWEQGDSYEIQVANTGNNHVANFEMGINLMGAGQVAADIGYQNDTNGYANILHRGDTGHFSIGDNSTTKLTVNTNFGVFLMKGHILYVVITRELNDDLTVTMQRNSGTVFSGTQAFADLLRPLQVGRTWADVKGLYIGQYAKQLGTGLPAYELRVQLRKL